MSSVVCILCSLTFVETFLSIGCPAGNYLALCIITILFTIFKNMDEYSKIVFYPFYVVGSEVVLSMKEEP